MSFSSSHPYDLRQTIPGEPEIDYPIYSAVPTTNFDCNGRHEGYYADTEARCQVFRICANTDLVGRGFAFLCPNGTLFSQKNFVCDWYRNVDCNESERFYSKNDNNRIGTKSDMMKTVRQMMEHPMKTISIALNRGKSTTPQPALYSKLGTSSGTKTPRNVQTSTTPANRLPIQDNFHQEKQSIAQNQGEIDLRFSPSLEDSPTIGQKIEITSPSEGGFKPLNVGSSSITPPSPTFTPPFESPLIAPYEGPLSSNDASFETYNSATQGESLLPSTEESGSENEVYISSLGELSTDPGANFNRQTSRIISDPPSNELDISETKVVNASGLNFAEKVNAGLNGLEVLNNDGIIAPEYVKNIMQQQNVAVADEIIQPVPFDFASNINSLLDEVTYEAELEGPHSVQFQQQNSPIETSAPTKKPFRFLSRGFSHENSKDGETYAYRSTSAPRSSYRTTQHSTSTQSLSNSLITTLLTTTQTPVTSTESSQILTLENASENPQIESSDELNIKFGAPFTESNQINTLVDQENRSETVQDDRITESQISNTPAFDLESKPAVKREQKELKQLDSVGFVTNPSPVLNNEVKTDSELESTLHSKPAVKREQKELKQLDSVNSLKDTSTEANDEDKVDANKRAEDLLLAGVKQITVNDSDDEKSKTKEDESIVPIYNRVVEPQTSTPHITSSSSTAATPTSSTSSSSSTPAAVSSTTTDIPSTSSSTTTATSTEFSTTSEPTTTAAVSIRRFTVGSGKRRLTSRPISYSRRNNLPRSGQKTTVTPKSSTTTSAPAYRGRLGHRSTSTTPASSTTRTTKSPRKRLNINRVTYGSRRRTTESLVSTTSTTTITPPSKKLTVRSSDSAFSDLTAVASTYNASPNRAYNSIRQGSYKYSQTKRRLPIHHKNKTIETTTIKPLSKTSTTQQPRSTSSLPTPTLAPFSQHEALSPIPITSSTTPEPLPATFLSFNDLTKSITDDSILQTLRKKQDFNRQLVDSTAFRTLQQGSPRQQIPFSTAPRIQQVLSTQRPPLKVATTLPFIPLKDFIASKFGAQYSPEPPKLSTTRPSLITPNINNDFAPKIQTKTVFKQQYSNQESVRSQEFAPQINQVVKLSPSVLSPLNQNVFLQQSQLNVQQQQYQEQQLRLQQQQQQQKLQQLKQQQNHLQQEYQLQQQQKLQQQQQQQKIQQQLLQQQQQQNLHQQQSPPQQYFSSNQQQIFPTQQYTQLQQTVQQQQSQQQRIPFQQQVSTKIIPSVEQQFEIQRSQQLQQPITLTPQQQLQQAQIQIIPSQMTMSQTIRPQQSSNSNVKSEIGSINVRLPSNLAGLIPNTNIFDSDRNSNSLESAQRRSDLAFEDTYGGGARERKSVFAGVSSYDVPLSSVGRLANDVTHLLRQRRL
ncbi:mucin-17 [Episyrphus balteatus]|uniref:mucin-17 n=1 Tax=Episyrphus balteatus TaxID=286459 RepID=UPI0024851557|nr:mucin-17 [Episyrphus balteatus]